MASPLVNHLVSDWFENANGQEVLSAIREECRWRSDQIRARLTPYGVRTQTNGFHAWLPLPVPEDGACMASDMASELRSLGVAAVAGSTFSTDRNPPEGLRICLGGCTDPGRLRPGAAGRGGLTGELCVPKDGRLR